MVEPPQGAVDYFLHATVFFFLRLITHAQHVGSKVFIVNEHFTSQTGGQCGNLHTELGGNKRFKCPSCKVVLLGLGTFSIVWISLS
jgi:hypothetical protein